MTFENIIKRVSQVLAAAFMFLMADGFYLRRCGRPPAAWCPAVLK